MLYINGMNNKHYNQIKVSASIFLALVVIAAIIRGSYLLAGIAGAASLLFLRLVRVKARAVIDEREKSIQEKAAQITYKIFAPTLGLSALIMLLFARDEYYFMESLGIIFAYLTIFLITLYTISYFFFNGKYGGNGEE
jgi:uncharacterized membrane protein